MIIVRGFIGILGLILIALLVSRKRKAIDWKQVGLALILQTALAASILYIPMVSDVMEFVGQGFVKILEFTKAGAAFLLGSLVDMSKLGHIFLFQVLPVTIFFAALTSLLYYYGIIQKVVWLLAFVFRKILRISGAEGLVISGNIFLGQCESPMLTKKYLPQMTSSEMFLVLVSGMATIAGGVMGVYIMMLGGGDKQSEILFAKHLISASVMAAPGAVLMAKIIFPEDEEPTAKIEVSKDSVGVNFFDALSSGTTEGVKLAVNIAAMLLVIISLVAMLNHLLGGLIGNWTGLNQLIASSSGGQFGSLSLEYILSWVFYPVAWLIGVAREDLNLVSALIGKKLAINEFVAYTDLNAMKNAGQFLSPRSIVLSTYVLCGFANISSIGMLIGGIGLLAPTKRVFITRYGMLALIGATLTSCLSATIVGMMIYY